MYCVLRVERWLLFVVWCVLLAVCCLFVLIAARCL